MPLKYFVVSKPWASGEKQTKPLPFLVATLRLESSAEATDVRRNMLAGYWLTRQGTCCSRR